MSEIQLEKLILNTFDRIRSINPLLFKLLYPRMVQVFFFLQIEIRKIMKLEDQYAFNNDI